jgi:glyoxylase-like metal-dependent hydrolase (beta-lactamase superfamily II)
VTAPPPPTRRRPFQLTAFRFAYNAVAVFALLAAAAVYWLFYDNRLPANPAYRLDIAAIRAEAARLPGPGPAAIAVEKIVQEDLPHIAMEAGADWGNITLVRASYRLAWADGRTAVIDTGQDEASAMANPRAHSYNRAGWGRMQAAMVSASFVAVTHEHADHIGGLIASPGTAAMAHAVLNPEQLRDMPGSPVPWPPHKRDGVTPLAYAGLRAVAPGVVLIRAPGHTPGSQMIYVRRADGREFLFMGDVASLMGNVEHQATRSRLVTDFMTHEDRDAVMGQTMALHALYAQQPGIVLVPGHDLAAIGRLISAGALQPGFGLGPG